MRVCLNVCLIVCVYVCVCAFVPKYVCTLRSIWLEKYAAIWGKVEAALFRRRLDARARTNSVKSELLGLSVSACRPTVVGIVSLQERSDEKLERIIEQGVT